MAATKEAILAKQHEADAAVTIYYMDLRAYGKDFDRYYNRAKELGFPMCGAALPRWRK